MAEKTITVTIPEGLHEKVTELVDAGLFADFGEAVRAGLRDLLLEAALIERPAFDDLPDHERFAFYVERLRRRIRARGGLFPGKTPEEILQALRDTREEIFWGKYAHHFGLK